jgi:hypothetical protein
MENSICKIKITGATQMNLKGEEKQIQKNKH